MAEPNELDRAISELDYYRTARAAADLAISRYDEKVAKIKTQYEIDLNQTVEAIRLSIAERDSIDAQTAALRSKVDALIAMHGQPGANSDIGFGAHDATVSTKEWGT